MLSTQMLSAIESNNAPMTCAQVNTALGREAKMLGYVQATMKELLNATPPLVEVAGKVNAATGKGRPAVQYTVTDAGREILAPAAE